MWCDVTLEILWGTISVSLNSASKSLLCKISRVMKYLSWLDLPCLKSRTNYIYYKSMLFTLFSFFAATERYCKKRRHDTAGKARESRRWGAAVQVGRAEVIPSSATNLWSCLRHLTSLRQLLFRETAISSPLVVGPPWSRLHSLTTHYSASRWSFSNVGRLKLQRHSPFP